MTRLQLRWGIIFFVFSLVLFSLLFFYKDKSSSTSNEKKLGYIQQQTGEVFVFDSNTLSKNKIARQSPIFHMDRIETADFGSGELVLNNTDSVLILDSSTIQVEQADSSDEILVTILKGDLQVKNFNAENQTLISKNGKRIFLKDYNESLLKKETTSNEEKNTQDQNPPDTSVNTEMLIDALQRNKSAFYKCYTQLLQKNSEAKGLLEISLTITANGKTKDTQITTSEIKDQTFKDCVVEVTKRIQFPAFNGDSVSILFPIQFE